MASVFPAGVDTFSTKVDRGVVYHTDINNMQDAIVALETNLQTSVTGGFNVMSAEFGAVGDGVADDTTAITAAIAACELAGGGVVFFPPGTYKTTSLITLDTEKVILMGCGNATKIACTSTTGAFLITYSYISICNMWIYCSGAGAYAVKSYNTRIFNTPSGDQSVRSRGPEHLTLRDLKITGASGIAYGLYLINTWFSTFENILMPGGDGTAIAVESGGFNTFSHITATNQYDDAGLNAWDRGIDLYIQPDLSGVNSQQQCDDNLFESCAIDGIEGYDLYIHSSGAADTDGGAGIQGVGPARNEFNRCLFGANTNTYPCVLLENAWRNTFVRCHAEQTSDGTPDDYWTITGTATGNAWYNCSGPVKLHTPASTDAIQGNALYDHVGIITVGSGVWATDIINAHSLPADSGTNTRIYYTQTNGTAGAQVVTSKVPSLGFSKMATGTDASGTLWYSNGAPSSSIGSNGDVSFRDNPIAGAGIYQKRDGIWMGVAGYPNLVRGTFTKTSLVDNAATAIFTVTTTNESGGADGGAYICNVTALCTHIATSGAGNNAVIKYRGSFSREVIGAGTGANTAVEDTFTASTSATRDISGVTMTVTETSEYVQTVNLAVNLTGSDVQTAEVTVLVEVIYSGFLTTPTLAQA
jgi:hypothetical protein